jgi:hypothetical protein
MEVIKVYAGPQNLLKFGEGATALGEPCLVRRQVARDDIWGTGGRDQGSEISSTAQIGT